MRKRSGLSNRLQKAAYSERLTEQSNVKLVEFEQFKNPAAVNAVVLSLVF